MLRIWLFFVGEMILCIFVNFFTIDTEVAAITFVGIHVIWSTLILFTYKRVFLLAYIVRLLAMVWDLYMRDIFLLPNSGSDTEGFFRDSIYLTQQVFSYTDSISGGIYSKICGVLFEFTFPERIMGQYMNVLLGITTLYFIYRILIELEIRHDIINKILLIFAFLPNSIIMAAINLREDWIACLTTISLYFFVRWFKDSAMRNLFFSFIFLLCASMFHAGIFMVAIGYAFAAMFYKNNFQGYVFTLKSIVMMFIIFGCFSLLIFNFTSLFFGKFDIMINSGDATGVVYDKINYADTGGSAYLIGYEVTSPLTFILYTPIRLLYFYLSPMPWTFYRLQDFVAFIFDGIFYWYAFFNIVKSLKTTSMKHPIIISIFFSILFFGLVFGMGTSNTGTAMRHRYKVLPIVLVMCALTMNSKLKDDKEGKNNKIQDNTRQYYYH